jgi:hypothetical protein
MSSLGLVIAPPDPVHLPLPCRTSAAVHIQSGQSAIAVQDRLEMASLAVYLSDCFCSMPALARNPARCPISQIIWRGSCGKLRSPASD